MALRDDPADGPALATGDDRSVRRRVFCGGGAGAAAVLLEREGELAVLGSALSRARNASGRVVLDRGPGGDRQDPPARRGRRSRSCAGIRGAGGARRRARVRLWIRCRAPVARSAAGARVVRRSYGAPVGRGGAVSGRLLGAGAAPGSSAGTDSAEAVLHGLYWLDRQPRRAGAADARDRRRAVGRRSVAALPAVPRAPVGGDARRARARGANRRGRRRSASCCGRCAWRRTRRCSNPAC